MMSYKVRFWSIRVMKGRQRPYGVRWLVEGKEFSEWFIGRTLADNYRSELMQAAKRGEPFDTVTGLPESQFRQQQAGTWYEHTRAFVAMRWPGAPAKTRSTIADCLAVVTPVLVASQKGAPDIRVLRRSLSSWAFNMTRNDQTPPSDVAAALKWVR